MLRPVALVRADVSEELSVSIIRVTRISELGTLAVTSNRRGQISWLQTDVSGSNPGVSRIAVGLERGPLTFMRINEELLERKVAAPV
jgi:hypothetical protein